jgi:hypothetical protein
MPPPSLLPDPELDPEPDAPPSLLPDPELDPEPGPPPSLLPDPEPVPGIMLELDPEPDPGPDEPELASLDVVSDLGTEPELPAPSEEEQAARKGTKVNAKLREWFDMDTFFPRNTGRRRREA